MAVDVSATLPILRRARGLTQEQLGAKAGIARTDIVAFETGKKPVGTARLQRLADALEVSPAELGAPAGADDPDYRSLPARQEELEAAVLTLTREVRRLARRVRELEQRALPGAGEGEAAR